MNHSSKNKETFALDQSTIATKKGEEKPKLLDVGRKSQKGQSFVELSLVIIFLMIFVAGIVEFGFMLNNYLNLVDASREAVRYSSNFDPFIPGCTDHSDSSCWDENFFNQTFQLTEDVLAPLVLDSSKGDDIVVSFFSVADGVYIRYPNEEGKSRYLNQVSKLSNAEIQSRLDNNAPPTGVLLVEIFYHYAQVLKLPVFTAFVPDPIPEYAYAIMPLTAAEPVVTGGAGGGGGGGGGGGEWPTSTIDPYTPLPTNTPVPTNTPLPTETPISTNTPSNCERYWWLHCTPTSAIVPTDTFPPTPSFTATATPTATSTQTFTPAAPPTDTPTLTATSFVCNVSASNIYLESSSVLAADITNNTNKVLHYSNITIFFNAWSPRYQRLEEIVNGGTTLWTGSVSSSPASGSIGGEAAPWSTTRLEFHFRRYYQITGVEHILLEFQENGCQMLDIQ